MSLSLPELFLVAFMAVCLLMAASIYLVAAWTAFWNWYDDRAKRWRRVQRFEHDRAMYSVGRDVYQEFRK